MSALTLKNTKTLSSLFFHCRHLSSKQLSDVYIVSCARTPLGSFQGSLASKSATQLGAEAIKNAVDRAKLDKSAVQEVFMGCVVQAGVGQAPARQAALFAGLSEGTACTTVNKVCASGMKSIMLAAASLAIGHQDVIVAGGMESLSNTPFYLNRGSTPYGQITLRDSCNFDALTDVYTSWHMGKCAENTVSKMKITRKEQDDYARLSYDRYMNALSRGVYDNEIVPVDLGKQGLLDKDEEPSKHDWNSLSSLPAIWGETIARSSSSKLADGAAACVLVNEDALKRYNLKPMAKILGFRDSAQNPVEWPTSPAKGIEVLLKEKNLSKDDISLWEINEAFAVVVLANAKLLNLDLNKVNVNGGAICIGHPFGMSGARLTNHLALNLKPGQLGIASLCNGGGGAASILLEKL